MAPQDSAGIGGTPTSVLREQAEHHRDYVAHAPLAIMVVDASGRYVDVNPAACRLSGYEESELLAISLTDLLAEESLEAGRQHFAKVKESGRASGEVCWIRKDGSERWSVCDALKLSEDRFIAYCLDVTDRKLAEESLRQSQAELRAIYDHAPVMMCVLDSDRRVIYANRALQEFAGKPENSLQGGCPGGILGCVIASEDARGCGYGSRCESCPLRMAILDTLRTGASHRGVDYTLTLERGGNRQDVAFLAATALLESKGRPRLLLCLEDVTERKARKREIERLNRLYAALSELNQIVARIKSREELFREVCRIATENAGFQLAWIGWIEKETQRVVPIARAGEKQDYLDEIEVYADDRPEGQGPTGSCIREDRVYVVRDLWTEPCAAPWHAAIAQRGFRTSAAMPIRFQGTVCGALTAYDREPDVIQGKEIALLEEAAAAISRALENLDHESKRKQAEEALRESEEWHRTILQTALDGFWLVDTSARILEVNDAYCRMSGYSRRELLGMSIPDLEAVETRDDTAARIQSVVRRGEHRFETRHRRKDGSVFDVDASVQYRSVDGGRLLTFFRDITERKRAEMMLRASEEKFRNLFNNAEVGMFRSHLDGSEVLDANERYLSILGRTREEAVGKPSVILWADANEREAMVKTLQARGCVHDFECRMTRPDGKVINCLTSLKLYPEQGTLEGSIIDITDRKRAEQEKLELERRLLHAQKLESLGVLAGGIAHDFNNILAGIMGYADLAKRRLAPSEPACDDIDVIKKAAQRAADLTRQMLAYSGKGKFIVEPVSLSQVAEDCKKMLAMSVSKKATVTYNLASDLPTTQADASQIHQVILNLVINASEALGEQSGIIAISTDTIRLSATDCAAINGGTNLQAGLYVRLEVADSGCGMDRETLGKIFDPFFTTKFTGRGLGLAAVQGIVRGHKGAIQVFSEPGQGTKFQVLFPAMAATSPLAVSESIVAEPWHGAGTVLIVDDEEIVRTLASRMAEHAGFAVLTANDGEEAVRLYRQRQAEVVCVLLDLTMPKMNGEETFRELRKIRPDLRVILSSGYSAEGVTERFAGLGLAGFVQKPYQFEKMIGTLRAVLSDQGA